MVDKESGVSDMDGAYPFSTALQPQQQMQITGTPST
jgi:hypothetical protein